MRVDGSAGSFVRVRKGALLGVHTRVRKYA